ncbi:stress protein DDR48-like [Pomacea canaliculata]|uniref:stress protein DDR48-like n=1 Tax=Pomacea canaliculata TaxID=400727 RepID=UPI000D73FF6B|nr:stress protein DDR48-like [Pomacea canaliculata]
MKPLVLALLCLCTEILAVYLPLGGSTFDVEKGLKNKTLPQEAVVMNWATGRSFKPLDSCQMLKAKDIGRVNSIRSDSANKASSSAFDTASDYAQKSNSRDNAASAADKAAKKASAAAKSNLFDKNSKSSVPQVDRAGSSWQSDVKDQSWTANTDFNDGNRAKDKADYAYDKSFDTEDTKTGGVVISQDNKVNNIDNDYDRAYQRQPAGSWTQLQAAQDAAAAGSTKNSFGREANAGDQVWNGKQASSGQVGTNQLLNDKGLLEANGGNLQSQKNVLKDDSTSSGLRAFKGIGNGLGGIGLGGLGVFSGDLSLATGAQDYGSSSNQGAANNLQSQRGINFGESNNNDFHGSLLAAQSDKGFGDSRAAFANDQGFAGKSNDARQQSQAASSDWGKALAAKAADENNNDFGENVRFSDNVRQKFAKSNQGTQVLKKFFNDDNKRGDNHERLKFNRDDDLDKFGFKNNKRTDSGRAASDGKQTVRDVAASRTAAAARAAETARDAQQSDWADARSGQSNQKASAWNNAEQQKKGVRNGLNLLNIDQNRVDNSYGKDADRHRGAKNLPWLQLQAACRLISLSLLPSPSPTTTLSHRQLPLSCNKENSEHVHEILQLSFLKKICC